MESADLLARIHDTARDYTGWLKFVGILLIVTGIPTLVILVGALNIWMGVLLFQGALAIEQDGEAGVLTLVERLGTYFRIYGVVTLIGLVCGLIAIMFGLFGAFAAITNSGMLT